MIGYQHKSTNGNTKGVELYYVGGSFSYLVAHVDDYSLPLWLPSVADYSL